MCPVEGGRGRERRRNQFSHTMELAMSISHHCSTLEVSVGQRGEGWERRGGWGQTGEGEEGEEEDERNKEERRVRHPWGRLGRQKERYVSVAVSPPWL